MDEAIKLLGSEAIKLLGYEAIRLYGHMAVNTELNTEFGADPIYCQPHEPFSDVCFVFVFALCFCVCSFCWRLCKLRVCFVFPCGK